MNWQKGVGVKFFIAIYRMCASFHRLVYSLTAWSPFLIKVFDVMIGTVKLRVMKLARYILPNPTNVEAHVLFYNPGDTSLIISLSLGSYEPEVRKTVMQFLQPGMTMIDAGANIGYYTLLAARAVGTGGHVYAFEAVPCTAALLRKNIEVNGYSSQVTIVPKAVIDRSSQVRIFLNYETSGASSMFWGHGEDFVDVEGVSLDEFFSKQGWPPINIIKMDIEGAEKLALKGMRELSQRNPELKLIIEGCVRSTNIGELTIKEVAEALQACGFSRFYLLEDHIREVNIFEEIPNIVPSVRGFGVHLLCEKSD